MLCKNCGSNIPEHSQFCPNCGKQVIPNQQTTEIPPQPQIIQNQSVQNEPAKKNFWVRAYWPDVSDIDSAKGAIYEGMWASFFVAFITSLLSIFNYMGYNAYNFIDAGLFLVIGIFLLRKSRIAAICGLILYFIEKVGQFAFLSSIQSTSVSGLILIVLIFLAYINSVRGVFAYHKLKNQNISVQTI